MKRNLFFFLSFYDLSIVDNIVGVCIDRVETNIFYYYVLEFQKHVHRKPITRDAISRIESTVYKR